LGNTILFILTLVTLFLEPVFPLALHKNLYDILFSAILLMASPAILTGVSGQIYLAVIIAMMVGKYASVQNTDYK
jgi:hypothetical protein